jgi:hypothetical protein
MNVQFGHGVFSYPGPAKVGPPQAHEAAANSALPASQAGAGSAGAADKVTLSAAAQALAAGESPATQARTPAQERLLGLGASDPRQADQLASDLANTPSTIFYDLRGARGDQPLNKLSSGRLIDDAFKEKFASEASVIDTQRQALYDSEKAKGTPPLEILGKVMDFMNAQSSDYLEASGWGR